MRKKKATRFIAFALVFCMVIGTCITGYADDVITASESSAVTRSDNLDIDAPDIAMQTESGNDLTVSQGTNTAADPGQTGEEPDQPSASVQAMINALPDEITDVDSVMAQMEAIDSAMDELDSAQLAALDMAPYNKVLALFNTENAQTLEDDAVREATEFPFDAYLDSLNVKITDANGEHEISYTSGDSTDIDMGEIQRNATLAIILAFDPNKAAGNDGGDKNPIIYGDTFSCAIPDILSNANGGKWTGRLKDATTEYGQANGSIGDFVIENGKLTIKFDKGYIDETAGNIMNASLNFNGSFDAYGWDETAFVKNLYFGNLPVTVHFPAADVLRNLSIEKTPVNYGSSDYSNSYSGLQGRGALNGTAKVDAAGYITYSIKVTAAEDNTTFLDNVIISDVFTTDNVDPSSVVLLTAVKGTKDTNIMNEVEAQVDTAGNITGWNIGRLNRGEEATITFKIKIDKDKITEDVDDVRSTNPDASAEAERLIKNTASATADKMPNPVTADAATIVQNYLSVAKSTDGYYDPDTNRQKFKITITAPADNKYTEHDIYIRDRQDSFDKWYVDAGITGMSVKHADGTVTESTDADPLYYGFETDSSVQWHAYLKELAPGDVATIYTYVEIDPDLFYKEEGSSGTNGPSNVYNYIYAGGGDLRQSYLYCNYYITKQWISKSGSYSAADGTITWTMTGNSYDSDVPDADITGMEVKDILGANQTMADSEVLVTFYEPNSSKVRPYDGDDAQDGKMVVQTTSTGFSFNIPNGFGDCKFSVTYKTIVENNFGPAASYYNTGKLGVWSVQASTTRPRIASIEKAYVERGADWAKWAVRILGPVKNGDVLTDTLSSSPDLMWFDQNDIDGIEVSFNGKTIDRSLYTLVPAASSTAGKNKGFTLTFLAAIVDTGADGKEITPTSQNPVTVTYKSHLAYRTYNNQTMYENTASYISAGVTIDKSSTYFYRSTYPEITKSYKKTVGSDITWTLRLNNYGYGCYLIDEDKNPVYYQNKGGGQQAGYYTIVTETIPKGLEYISAKYDGVKGFYAQIPTIEELSRTENEDGSTTVKLLIGNLVHYEGNPNNTSVYKNLGYYYVDINIITQIVDKECLLDTTGKDFTWNNTASLTSMDGQPYESKAAMNISHVALSKNMVYDGSTAPNAVFTIEMNKEEFDLDPESDTIKVFDKSASTLAVDTSSIKVIDIRDNSPVDFVLDASQMAADGTFSIEVPDNKPLRITYSAGVSGVKGEEVSVSNNAYFEGQKIEEVTSRIEQVVTVLNAEAQAQSSVMIWLKKMDATGTVLPGCVFKLEKYTETNGWTVVNDNIVTEDATHYGTKVSGLDKDVLYRLVETKTVENFILNEKPYYFCLKLTQDSVVKMPENFNETVYYCSVAQVINAYNTPYVPVSFRKLNGEGTPLPGAEFKVVIPGTGTEDNPEETVAEDKNGVKVIFATSETAPPAPPTPPTPPEGEPELASVTADDEGGDASGTDQTEIPTFYMKPGTYTLVETKAPDGYLPAAPITFTVNSDKTVSVANKRVENNVVVCTDVPTSVVISKIDGTESARTELAGAVLQILEGTTVKDEWTTDGTYHTITGVLNTGTTYTLHESQAPDGYLLADDISFSINNDGAVNCTATLGDGSSVIDDNGVLMMVDKKPSLDILKINKSKNVNQEANTPLEDVSLTMTCGENTQVRTWTTAADAEHFDELEADVTYTITENSAPDGYVIIDPFDVTLNADGTVTVTGTDAVYADGTLTISNEYVPTPVEVEITVHKAITGSPVSSKVFTFELKDADDNTETITITGEGEETFPKKTFTEAGTYTYSLSETEGSDKGYTYASSSHSIVIEVSDDGKGTLSKEVTIDGEESEEVTITNTYEPLQTKLSIPVDKTFTQDSEPRPFDQDFTFTIEGKTGTEPLPAVTSITADENNNGTFKDITYTTTGTYEYTVTETDDGKTGYTYADPITFKVVVEDNDGQLEAAVFIGDEEVTELTFENEYQPLSAAVSLIVKKEFTEDSEPRPTVEDFTFTIAGKTGTEPLPDVTAITANENAAGTFEDITFTSAGTYEYVITETDDAKTGYTYADPITVKVEVEDVDGQLEAIAYIGDEEAAELVFENEYKPLTAELPLTVKKEFTEDSEPRPTVEDFTFTIAGKTGTEPMPAVTTITANENVAGTFENITYTSAGTYEYVITETDDAKTGYTYADPITVRVEVEDNESQLEATVFIGDEEVAEIAFENEYTPNSASLPLTVKKEFTKESDKRPGTENFTFTIAGKTGTEPMPAVTTITANENAPGAFESATYTAAGTYEYVITEKNDAKEGYTYADPITVKVVVKDNDGQLEAKIFIGEEEKEDIVFTNGYKAPSQNAVPTNNGIKTGDNGHMLLLGMLLVVSVLIILVNLIYILRRRRHN